MADSGATDEEIRVPGIANLPIGCGRLARGLVAEEAREHFDIYGTSTTGRSVFLTCGRNSQHSGLRHCREDGDADAAFPLRQAQAL
jgi:hypothetical protein